MASEAILCFKNGRELFEQTQAFNIVVWLFVQLIVSVLFVFGCVLWHRFFQVRMTFLNNCNFFKYLTIIHFLGSGTRRRRFETIKEEIFTQGEQK